MVSKIAVDISNKVISERIAIAEGIFQITKKTYFLIQNKQIQKGDVFENARLAAIHAVKQTPFLVFMCHPIPIYQIKVSFETQDLSDHAEIKINVQVKTQAKTGCEIEALAGVMNGLLNIFDLVKMYEKDSSGNYPHSKITDIHVISKTKSPVSG